MGEKKQTSGLWETFQAQVSVIFSLFPFMVSFFFWHKTPPRFVLRWSKLDTGEHQHQ